MNAQLKPLPVTVFERPTYRRSDLLGTYRDEWLAANADLIRGWYDQLSGCICESEPQVSYDEFALAQHDLEEMRRDDYRQTLRQS